MPPDEEPLSAQQIAALERWVQLGAPWPASSAPLASNNNKARDHWAFLPVREPAVPAVENAARVRMPIDNFVLAKLAAAQLSPSPEADRRTLIRRASYALTGLPPSSAEVAQFVADDDPQAYEKLVERLLASPDYGQQWARHWLDVARYSDTKGYVYAREERFWIHAWPYRDWVAAAMNSDMPYDRFLLLQLAADQVDDRRPEDLAAMGFLTLGRRFLGVKHDIIDDRIDVVTRGTMGLTVGCARCHDHKYDPIPTADYYSLYGVFDSCAERVVPLDQAAIDANDAFAKELQQRLARLQAETAKQRAEAAVRVRSRLREYLAAQTDLEKWPPEGFDQILQPADLFPSFVRRWAAHLRDAKRTADPVFAHWHAYAALPADRFARAAAEVKLDTLTNPLVAQAFATPPRSFAEVVDRYVQLLADIDSRWQAALAAAAKTGAPRPSGLDDPPAEALRSVLYGPTAPCEVPDEPIVHTESYFPTSVCENLWKLQGEVDRWIIQSNQRYALTLVDRARPSEPRIFRRGNPKQTTDDVPRQFVSLLRGADDKPFAHGSGRLELAQAIIDPANPLTARVIVNRVWAHHFGRGLVATPSDFGTRAQAPLHPELLDWLAARFVAEGWSLKKLHRWIMLSSTYRQAATGPTDDAALAAAVRVDPANRLLWRMNQRRLSFEEFRDSLLAVSGQLDRSAGGKPVNIFNPPFPKRRTLYGLVDRQFLPGTLRMFDFANPDLHIPERSETTVPQQALFLLNHPLVLEQTRALAQSSQKDSPAATVAALFQAAYQRPPTDDELADAIAFVRREEPQLAKARATAADWQYGYGALDEQTQRVTGFTALPHFNGAAWQGGQQWPDAKLGWVQLTAEGGHPGNTRTHASVRRWIAPRAMTVRIASKLTHDAAPGDGIRAFLVSSRAGKLQSVAIHQKQMDLNVDLLAVEAGETIDFVVDIGDVLNSDQYLWTATITPAGDESAVAWDSRADFPAGAASSLTPWEQFAQILLCTNEFLFVD
jgi:hypothetical protein